MSDMFIKIYAKITVRHHRTQKPMVSLLCAGCGEGVRPIGMTATTLPPPPLHCRRPHPPPSLAGAAPSSPPPDGWRNHELPPPTAGAGAAPPLLTPAPKSAAVPSRAPLPPCRRRTEVPFSLDAVATRDHPLPLRLP
jgi:hypothetical protein